MTFPLHNLISLLKKPDATWQTTPEWGIHVFDAAQTTSGTSTGLQASPQRARRKGRHLVLLTNQAPYLSLKF